MRVTYKDPEVIELDSDNIGPLFVKNYMMDFEKTGSGIYRVNVSKISRPGMNMNGKVQALDNDVGPSLKSYAVGLFHGDQPFNAACLDMEDIEHLNSSGLSAVLVFNRLSQYNIPNEDAHFIMAEGSQPHRLVTFAGFGPLLNIQFSKDEFMEYMERYIQEHDLWTPAHL